MRKKIILILACSAAGLFIFISMALSGADNKKKEDLYRQIELFSDTLTIVQSEYVDETKPKDLIYGALKGMLGSLDMHSQFMDPDAYNELKVDTKGKFGGLGIEVTMKDGLLTVITPIEDTPAWRAGIKPLDKIIKINNDITRDMTLSDAVKKMRGKPGEAVTLTILREAESKTLEFKIIRDIIKIKDVKEAKIINDGIGYIRLNEFREDTAKNINAALNTLTKEKMNALILDLRNNPGGLLEIAVEVAGKFIPKGKLVVYTKSRKEQQDLQFFSDSNQPILDLPMVVLINEGSASGSEIVAAALQDYKRAIIMGKKSFGKGSVQTVIPLGDGSALKLTTSKYFAPKGAEIHGKGVVPDIVVEDAKADPDPAKDANPQEVSKDAEIKGPESDIQVMRAVDLLKAAKFYKGS